jgi:hypothetical protein
MFAAWEDDRCIPDAVFGAVADHPVLEDLLQHAIKNIAKGAWESGPGGFTKLLPGRDDVVLLPPGAFYDVHYLEQRRMDEPRKPWEFCRHLYHGSWLTDEQRERNEAAQQ